MTALNIPRNPGALSAAWLTAALRAGGSIGTATVASFDYEPIAAGVAFLGRLGRLRLRYADTEGREPGSLIVKLPCEDAPSRRLAKMFRFYEREVRFYSEIGRSAGIRIPALHYGAIDPANGDFVMLLEDLAPARAGDQLEGCSVEQARLAITGIAECHARWWRSPALQALTWMPKINDSVQDFAQPVYQQSWGRFVHFIGDRLSPSLRKLGEDLSTRIPELQGPIADRPQTLLHGNYRADNLFFGSGAGGAKLAVIDWQTACKGNGAFDLGCFLSGNVVPELRRAHESSFLRLYVATLNRHGVHHYGYDECLQDYRRATLWSLVYAVIAIGTLNPANARGLALFHANAQRVLTAIVDLDAGAILQR